MIPVHVTSETGPLKSVIIGYPDNFLDVEAEIINETQKKYYFGPDAPQKALIIEQLNRYADTLTSLGVTVYRPRPIANVPDQMMTRDIGVVINNTFLVTSMAAKSRVREWRGITYLFEEFDSAEIFVMPEDFVLEGGDIVVDKGIVYVGVGQRTDQTGLDYLADHFPELTIVPVYTAAIEAGEDVLHLDCSFLPVGQNAALIYRDGLRGIPPSIMKNYDLIDVSREEQQQLATNVLNVSPEIVISRPAFGRVNDEMRKRGIEIIELPYTEPPKTGGSFRCCSLPLFREEIGT